MSLEWSKHRNTERKTRQNEHRPFPDEAFPHFKVEMCQTPKKGAHKAAACWENIAIKAF